MANEEDVNGPDTAEPITEPPPVKPSPNVSTKSAATLDVRAKQVFTLQIPKGFVLSDETGAVPVEHAFRLEQPAQLESGESGTRVHEKGIPVSLTWLPGEEKTGLSVRLRQIPQFREAVRTKKLVVIERSS